MASENMIKEMTSDIKRFRKKPVSDITNYIEEKGEGLYVVGLDSYVGFIHNHNNQMMFIHSNNYKPYIGVVQEKLVGKNPLNGSNYRIMGEIFDDEMIRKWILGTIF